MKKAKLEEVYLIKSDNISPDRLFLMPKFIKKLIKEYKENNAYMIPEGAFHIISQDEAKKIKWR